MRARSCARNRILRQLEGRGVSAHALTHAHLDHYGSSHAVCEALGIPLWCSERDAPRGAGRSPRPGRGPGRRTGGQSCRSRSRTRSSASSRRETRWAGSRSWRHPATPRPHLVLARLRPHAHLRRRLLQPQPAHRSARASRAAAALDPQRRPEPRVRPPRCPPPACADALRPWPAAARHRALGALRAGAAGLSRPSHPRPCHH